MRTEDIDYRAGAVNLRGYLAFDETGAARPAFEAEMRAAAVRDWQVVSYGNTLHGFINPAADGSMMRTAMDSAQADRLSRGLDRGLFDEVL